MDCEDNAIAFLFRAISGLFTLFFYNFVSS